MIKMNSISGIVCYVNDLDKIAKFYEGLGFRPGERTEDSFKVYVNWFWIQFQKGEIETNISEAYTYIKVDDIDEFYKHVTSKGYEPHTEPVLVYGSKQFTIKDPEGYNLTFFSKK